MNLSITPQPPALSISLAATSANPGQSVAVSLSGDSAGLGYWVALAPVGAPSTMYVAWASLAAGATGNMWNPSMPSFAGTYEVRVFAPNFQLVASSASITVSAPTIPSQATLNVSASYAGTGSSVTVRLNNAPGGSMDWLVLAEVGAPTSQYINWVYVGNGVTNRDWTVTMPSTQKRYEFRLFLNNGSTLAGTSPSVLVANAPAVPPPLTSQTYAYDRNGNRTSAAGTTYTLGTGNRLATLSGALARSYTYDAAGNVLSDGVRTFTYSNAGRLHTVTFDGVTTTYAYNALGERVKKASGSGERHFVYDELGHLLGEYDGAGALIQETVWLGDIPVATLRPDGAGVSLFYIHTDHLNTPRRITRPFDNAMVWRWDSNPFGDSLANENPQGVGAFTYNLRFPGQYFDAESGTHYNYFRDYDPAVGRYSQSDPIGLRGGINTYAYSLNNPILLSDPLGLDAAMCRAALRAAGAIALGGVGASCGCALGGAAGGLAGLPAGGVGAIPGAGVGCAAGGAAGAVAGAVAGAAVGDTAADAVCKEEEPDCKKATPWQLLRAGITDPHEFKTDYGAVPNSLFDICACKDGSVVIKAVGTCGKPGPSIPTGIRWK